MKTTNKLFALLLLLAVATPTALAATYKYQDESGNTVYSQNPPENPNTPYEILSNISSHARPGSNTAPPRSPSPTLQQDEEENDTVAREQQQAEQIREENCKAAKKNLEIYTVYRRIRNEEGEVVRISDDERQQKINEAKQAIQDFCD